MNEQDTLAWKEATARMDALESSIAPALKAVRATIEPECSALKTLISEMEERMDDEIVRCEICSEPFLLNDQDSQYSDIGWCCPKCGQVARDEIAKCDHRFAATDNDFGDPAQQCTNCGCVVEDDMLEGFLGPERYAQFQAGGMRAEGASE